MRIRLIMLMITSLFVTEGGELQAQTPGSSPTVMQRHSLPKCPDGSTGPDACYASPDFTAEKAAERLGDQSLIYWVDGTVLRVAARGERPQLCCTFSDDLMWIGKDAKSDIWGINFQLPSINKTILEMGLVTLKNGQYSLSLREPFKGGDAPAQAQRQDDLQGKIDIAEINSAYLMETRKVAIYTPPVPAPREGFSVVYMADGQDVKDFAGLIEPMIVKGQIRPTMLVAIWHGEGPFSATYPYDKRSREYLPDPKADPQAYERHEMFVLKEVIPFAEKSYHASTNRADRLIFGVSNGGALAISFGSRHPELFGQISGFGIATSPDTVDFKLLKQTSVFTGAGNYDGFFANSRGICDKAISAGDKCTFYSIYTGHNQAMWDYGFTHTLLSVFKR